MTFRTRLVVSVLVSLIASGCAYHAPAEPTSIAPVSSTSSAPARIQVLLASRADRSVDLTATVLTADGHVVPNVALTFALDSGTVSPTLALTSGTGTVQGVIVVTGSTMLTVTGAGLATSTSVTGAPAPTPTPPPMVPPPAPTPAPAPAPPAPPSPLSAYLGCTSTGTALVPFTASCAVYVSENNQLIPGSIASTIWTWGDGSFTPLTGSASAAAHTYPFGGYFIPYVDVTLGDNRTVRASTNFKVGP